jgi:hypothetical protein
VLTKDTKCPNQVFYVWLVDLQIICAKYGLETWFYPNDVIRKYFLGMKHGWNKSAIWDFINKKWRKWCKIVSPFISNNFYGLPVITKDTKCPNHVFYVSLVHLQTNCAKYGLETRFSSNNNIRICLLHMRHVWTTKRVLRRQ